jgi:hypothetical protein
VAAAYAAKLDALAKHEAQIANQVAGVPDGTAQGRARRRVGRQRSAASLVL